MLYIYMLGYDVDFGHMEAVSLISAPKYPEKQVLCDLIFLYLFKIYNNHPHFLHHPSCPYKLISFTHLAVLLFGTFHLFLFIL